MKLLAIRLCEHDSNISYFDGNVVHYYKPERNKQIKHFAYDNLWDWKTEIQQLWDITEDQLDEIAIVIDPWRHELPVDNEQFFPAIEYNHLPTNTKVWRVNHHYAHALSSWMLTQESNTHFVIDGFGDLNNAWTVFKDGNIIASGNLDKNGSIGQSMTGVGHYLGITASNANDIAGKVMGIQSYGKLDQKFYNDVELYGVKEANKLFDHANWVCHKQDPLLAKLTPLDWIRTVHERVGVALVEFFKQYASPNDKITYSGGVAQNVIWNTLLKENFPNLTIPPHCADDGLSLGALEWLRIKNNLQPFKINNFPFCQSDEMGESASIDKLIHVAKLLSEGKSVAVYQGNGEIGPRALGNRSILMDPRIVNGKELINKIKNREFYRPFGASVLETHKLEAFLDFPENPFMLYIAKPIGNYPAITHVDGTCRAQTVSDSSSPLFVILSEFYKLTGCPVLLNTSLNLAGKPIVGCKNDAINFLLNSNIDYLLVGDMLLTKDQ